MRELDSFRDGDFADAAWDISFVVASGTASGSSQRVSSGGNPGAYREITTSAETSSEGFLIAIRESASYTPAAGAPVTSISAECDSYIFEWPSFEAGITPEGVGFAIRQDGVDYLQFDSQFDAVMGEWVHRSFTGLAESDFRTIADANAHPDFSQPMQFGWFRRINQEADEDGTTLVRGIDNWSVTLYGATADRVRGSIQEDVGSIFDSVEVRAVDSGVSEAFFLDVELVDGSLVDFREALRPDTDAFRYYPLGQQTTEKLNAYSGETILSRMSRTYPFPIMRRVEDIPELAANLVEGVKVSAQDALQFIFDEWAAHAIIGQWFSAAAVPDLRVRRTDRDYSGTKGVLYTETISIPQIDERRLTMLDILREWLSAFPGTIARVNSAGNLTIVPLVGPDADSTPVVTLGLEDAYTVSEGKPDPTGVVNRWTVANTPITKQEDTPIMEPAWFQIMSVSNFNDTDAHITAPADRLDISGSDDFTEESNFNANRPGFWPVSPDLIPGGDAVKLTDSLGNKQITVAWVGRDFSSHPTGTIDPSDITLTDIPFDGSWVDAISINRGACSNFDSLKVTIRARWVATEKRTGIEFTLGSPMQLETCTWLNETTRRWTLGFTLSDASEAYAEDPAERKATFGIVENDDYIPSTSGANAVEESQNAHGVNEREHTIRVFEVDPEQLIDIATAGVLANIDPKVVREVEQSTWNAFKVEQDHVGRLVQLPNGEQGIVVSRSYVDDYSQGVAIASALKVRITSEIVDSDTAFLFLDDNTYFQLDDGTVAEES